MSAQAIRIEKIQDTQMSFGEVVGKLARVKIKTQEQKELRFIDLFAGLGGIRVGFQQACLELNMKAGKFFNADNISFVDYKHFNGNQTHIGSADSYTNQFNNLPYYSPRAGIPARRIQPSATSCSGMRKRLPPCAMYGFFTLRRCPNGKVRPRLKSTARRMSIR